VVAESTEFNVNDEAHKPGGAPTIADAQLKLAIACVEQRDLEAARRHAKLAAKHATPDWPHLASLGILLFQLSRFPAARRVLSQAAQNGPLGSEALKVLAALSHRAGEVAKARHCIAAWVQFNAIATPSYPQPDRPNLLRLRSVEKSYFGIKTDQSTGLRYCWLKGGHFSTQNLIDRNRCNLYIGTVFGNNPVRPDALPMLTWS
jgi:tetratricopeptide (TPR) repeat protein